MPEPCPCCDGIMPKRRSPHARSVMCKNCWKLVPKHLRKDHRLFNRMARVAGWPNQPAPDGLQPAWGVCSLRCQAAARAVRLGLTIH